MRAQLARAIIGSFLAVLTLVTALPVALGRRGPVCDRDYPPFVRCELEVVRGFVGSEKRAFFADPDVQTEFRKLGLKVEVVTVGSRSMACRKDLGEQDFAYPGSPWAAAKVQDAVARLRGEPVGRPPVPVAESPLVVVTFRTIAEALASADVPGFADGGGVVDAKLETFDVARYVSLFRAGRRWGQLSVESDGGKQSPPIPDVFPTSARVVLMSTRLDTSNSAEMLLALLGFAVNEGEKIRPQDVEAVRAAVADLFRAQGSTGASSDEPFEQYMSSMGYQLPMQLAYEAQPLGLLLREGAQRPTQEVVGASGQSVRLEPLMLFPKPGVVSVHTMAPLNEWGQRVADALVRDEDLIRLAAKHGFRPWQRPAVFEEAVKGRGGGVRLAPVTPQVALPDGPDKTWDALVEGVVDDVYGKERAGVACG